MISFLSFASLKSENRLLKEQIQQQAAKFTDEVWKYELFEQLKQLEDYLQQEPLIDIASWDVSVLGALEKLQSYRRHYQQAFLLVIADETVSPMSYLRAGIMPTALLMKPINKENTDMVIREMLQVFTERFEKKDVPKSFVIETREGKQFIPLSQIYYVEAREKKIYIRTRQEEYGFYETIENMEQKLPTSFCRCHRSYIVNMAKVTAVKASLNLIEMLDGMAIPLSRSYKKTIKEYHKHV